MKKKKIINLAILIIFVLSIVGIVYSIINIIDWKHDGDEINKTVDELKNEVEVIEKDDNENVKIVKQEEEIVEDNPYWSYIKMKLIDVDFSSLKEINNEVVGWIQINGTNINYPFVQTNNNSYYLTHDLKKQKNNAGWVFLDYRNNTDFTDKNTIIYAHGRYDKTMFGTLRNALSNGWLENINNYVFKISTEKENNLWEVFSIYRIPETSDYLYTNFSSDASYEKFIDLIKTRSEHNFNTTVSINDKILTLSTCYNEKERVVLHAKLIKYEKK